MSKNSKMDRDVEEEYMSALVLWKRLTENDFNAMHGTASPRGLGGGARHIALGVNNTAFPIADFLGRNATLTTVAQQGNHDVGELVFNSNPSRRRGEWLICDQFKHRHPAWRKSAGFPAHYDSNNPPYILIVRIGNTTHVRFILARALSQLPETALPAGIIDRSKGIQEASKAFLIELHIPFDTLLDTYNVELADYHPDAFDPDSLEDGRSRIVASIIRRQGQQDFRRKLLDAYNKQCAITRCPTLWVLEAAHITPYRGARTNVVSNGLLLRADVHTLFDLALISIAPDSMTIRVSQRLVDDSYLALEGRSIVIPRHSISRPNRDAIARHFKQFERQLGA